jgi:predicted dehydrogenase
MSTLRVAVIGAGSFGRHHVRVISQMPDVELTAVVDPNVEGARKNIDDVIGQIDAAIVATPTVTHESIAKRLLAAGIDVLVEKPIADTSQAAERLARLAQKNGRVLQAGHLERFNPAVTALENALTIPLFFEVHRLSVFTPRSLDIDVVLDLMIHDLDIVLSFVGAMPEEIRAAGISVLSSKVDIANVRLAFASGCIANLTASRISAEQVRKLRLFQPGEYISLDYHRQDAVRFAIRKNEAKIGFESLPVLPAEPLQLELAAFFASVRDRTPPRVDGFQAARALEVAESILAKIKEHADLVSDTIRSRGNLPSG